MADEDQSQTDQSLGTSDGSPPDYESLYKTEQGKVQLLEGDVKKLGADLSSVRGTVKSQRSRDTEFADELSGVREMVKVLARAQEAGNAEGLGKSVDDINEQTAGSVAASRFAARYESMLGDLQEAIQAADGTSVVLDLKTAPELEEARTLWSEGYTNTDLSYADRTDLFAQAISKTHKAVRVKERATAAAPAETKAESKSDDESDTTLDTDAGGGASGGSDTMKSLLAKDYKNMTLTEKTEYTKNLWARAAKDDGVYYPGV
ncbi:hypothetical protein LCGC14_0458270 [marine sediment metagenome]|uniref:Uncharacterized protein n=1 Tax=marine sediment metagenome TaxID=412755 RepID=A0A0F9SLA8_9ZZZZ